MPNFVPMRDYTFALADEMISTHGAKPPFLDAGCGQGAFSRHLATAHGWTGVASDSSPGAAEAARRTLVGTPVVVHDQAIESVEGTFRTVVLSTVIEHIRDDHAALTQLRTMLPAAPGEGHLIMSMPINPANEWRWDDDFYGHYRRYTRQDVEQLLASTGFKLVEFWDYTFPVYWAMRRVYTRALPAKTPPTGNKEADSAESSLSSAWSLKHGPSLIERLPVWKLGNAMQRRFRSGDRGFEAISLAVTA